MKRTILLLTIVSIFFLTRSSHISVGPADELHTFGVEDAFPKKYAEKYYSKKYGKNIKIKEAPDWLGPDSFGEDIFTDDEDNIEELTK